MARSEASGMHNQPARAWPNGPVAMPGTYADSAADLRTLASVADPAAGAIVGMSIGGAVTSWNQASAKPVGSSTARRFCVV